MENDSKRSREERLKTLLIEWVNDIRPFTEEQQTIFDKETVCFDIAPMIEAMKDIKQSVDRIMKASSRMGSVLYGVAVHDIEKEMDEPTFEQLMKDMGETQCH